MSETIKTSGSLILHMGLFIYGSVWLAQALTPLGYLTFSMITIGCLIQIFTCLDKLGFIPNNQQPKQTKN